MFTLQQVVAPSRRIVLGLAAVALAVTTLVSPASTAQAANVDPSVVRSLQLADLVATPVGKTVVGSSYTYTFSVTNLGPVKAPTVYVYQEAQLIRNDGLASAFQDNKWVTLGSLENGKTVPITVYCKQSNTYTCFQGDIFVKLGAGSVTDPNPNNNTAAIK